MQSGRSDGVGRSLPSLVAVLILAGAWGVLAQTPPPFQIRVETNVVMARVVVRDAKGRPVAGLRKEDFRLSDSGKPQEITGFAVETGNAGADQFTWGGVIGGHRLGPGRYTLIATPLGGTAKQLSFKLRP